MHRTLARVVPLVVLGAFFALPGEAEARRGIMLITHGDAVKHVGDVPAEVQSELRKETKTETKVGYCHQQFGVFWLEIWTWGGYYCLYDDDNNVWELEPAQAAAILDMPQNKLGKPFLYTFPPGLMIIVALVGLWAVVTLREKSNQKKVVAEINELLSDTRYKRALEMLKEHAEKEPAAEGAETPASEDDGGFEEAVQYLVSQGIRRDEAEQNLAKLIAVLAS